MNIRKNLSSASRALDQETRLLDASPILTVPVTPIIQAAERIVQVMSAHKDALQQALELYKRIHALHDAEKQCLGERGRKYVLKKLAVNAVRDASLIHRQALGRFRAEEVLKNFPDYAETRNVSQEQVCIHARVH